MWKKIRDPPSPLPEKKEKLKKRNNRLSTAEQFLLSYSSTLFFKRCSLFFWAQSKVNHSHFRMKFSKTFYDHLSITRISRYLFYSLPSVPFSLVAKSKVLSCLSSYLTPVSYLVISVGEKLLSWSSLGLFVKWAAKKYRARNVWCWKPNPCFSPAQRLQPNAHVLGEKGERKGECPHSRE